MIKIGWKSRKKDTARIKVQIRPSQTDQHYLAVLSLLKLGYILFVANTSKACLRQIEKYQFSKVKRVNASLHAGAHIEDSKVPAKEENLEIEALLFSSPAAFLLSNYKLLWGTLPAINDYIQPFLISTFMLSCVCMKDSPRSDELLYVNDHGLYYYILT